MDTAAILKIHETICAECREIMQRKQADYAGGTGLTPFRNFDLAPTLGICSREEGMLIRLSDKVSRIATLMRHPAQVKDESLRDTVRDLINYAVLIEASLIESKANT